MICCTYYFFFLFSPTLCHAPIPITAYHNSSFSPNTQYRTLSNVIYSPAPPPPPTFPLIPLYIQSVYHLGDGVYIYNHVYSKTKIKSTTRNSLGVRSREVSGALLHGLDTCVHTYIHTYIHTLQLCTERNQ
ncbi:hypothetical protein EJ05DRAFT_74468 [Pseudovirgaria hyperparasitica]|uniref:Uncharacterized protein n=1 Tax=Pseudovirgaria hyperparasitica TaxID=470096 RepID=A0A6A6W579_9PEZI|nr:uncharacterized protein EJ05DRAFT_74468 [Pseudovirgaria hyperparasitica]KAF2756717.1 hypothetical protein EJ05DRAFT_74468 [Pseudovirgaria hyperparasitica]